MLAVTNLHIFVGFAEDGSFSHRTVTIHHNCVVRIVGSPMREDTHANRSFDQISGGMYGYNRMLADAGTLFDYDCVVCRDYLRIDTSWGRDAS